MITDNFKALLLLILGVLLLLSVCVSIDYADDDISNINESSLPHNIPKGTIVMNNSSIVGVNGSASVIVVKHNDVIHTIKPKYPVVSMWAKPSVRSSYSYRWYKKTFIDYCPHCHRYGVLYNAHKWQARHEQEWTCRRCGADYCAVTGKEKYSFSKYYLRKA